MNVTTEFFISTQLKYTWKYVSADDVSDGLEMLDAMCDKALQLIFHTIRC